MKKNMYQLATLIVLVGCMYIFLPIQGQAETTGVGLTFVEDGLPEKKPEKTPEKPLTSDKTEKEQIIKHEVADSVSTKGLLPKTGEKLTLISILAGLLILIGCFYKIITQKLRER